MRGETFYGESLIRGSVHTQPAMLNVKLIFVLVWVEMPDIGRNGRKDGGRNE